MTPDKKNQVSHSILTLLVALSLLALLLRLWPVLLLLMLGLFGYGLWALIHALRQPAAVRPPAQEAPPVQPMPMSEQELLAAAFGLFQRRITEHVSAVYPHAKWVWSEPGARERFAAGGPLTILLNGAGGYQKAVVQVNGLQFSCLRYLPRNGGTEPEPDPAQPPEENDPPQVDYGLLAFEWVEANVQRLYAQNNEAISAGRVAFRIPAEELPHGGCWPPICAELARYGFAGAEPVANGIHVQIKPQGEENQQA